MIVPVSGNLAPSPFVFQAGAALGQIFRTLVVDLGPRRVALLRQADAATAPPTQFIDGLTAAGATVVGYQPVATPDQLSDALRTLIATRPDAIRTSAYPPFNGLVAVAARELGWDGRLCFGPAAGHPGFLETAGPAAEGVRITAPWSLVAAQAPQTVPNKLVMTSFTHDFEQANGPSGVYVGFAADAVHLLATALAAAADPGQTRLILENLAMVGVCGVYQMTPDNHNGLREGSLTTITVHNGQFVPGS